MKIYTNHTQHYSSYILFIFVSFYIIRSQKLPDRTSVSNCDLSKYKRKRYQRYPAQPATGKGFQNVNIEKWWNQCNSLVCWMFALQSVGREFDPRPSHTKDFKNGTCCFPCLALCIRDNVWKLNTHHCCSYCTKLCGPWAIATETEMGDVLCARMTLTKHFNEAWDFRPYCSWRG